MNGNADPGNASVKFVEVIQQSGFAYSLGGSVYFDIKAFEAAGNIYAVSKNHFHPSVQEGRLT